MRYVLLIYGNEAMGAQMNEQAQADEMTAYNQFSEAFKEKIVGGDALLPTTSATTVRVRDGKTLTTDGPFAETKEQLAGYYVVECADLDEATHIATHIPGATDGSIEIRPLMVFE